MADASAAARVASERLSRVIMSRTDLPLRDIAREARDAAAHMPIPGASISTERDFQRERCGDAAKRQAQHGLMAVGDHLSSPFCGGEGRCSDRLQADGGD